MVFDISVLIPKSCTAVVRSIFAPHIFAAKRDRATESEEREPSQRNDVDLNTGRTRLNARNTSAHPIRALHENNKVRLIASATSITQQQLKDDYVALTGSVASGLNYGARWIRYSHPVGLPDGDLEHGSTHRTHSTHVVHTVQTFTARMLVGKVRAGHLAHKATLLIDHSDLFVSIPEMDCAPLRKTRDGEEANAEDKCNVPDLLCARRSRCVEVRWIASPLE